MVNSHYIPQFILKNFYKNNKIQYCDIDNKTVESRNTRSVFAEKGYYPEQTEKNLCYKIERQFSILYHNKIENPGNSVVLTEEELFILKKYLIISSLRFKYECTESDQELIDQMGDSYKIDFANNLNKALRTENSQDLYHLIGGVGVGKIFASLMSGGQLNDEDVNVPLWAETKDIVNSYIIFIKTSGTEKFIIPDMGKGIVEGPMSREKLMYCISNPMLLQISLLLTPHDYTIYPLTKDIAILSMSVFYKLFTDSQESRFYGVPAGFPAIHEMLGFGSKSDIEPPRVSRDGGKKTYRYKVNRLNNNDIAHFNCVMMTEAKHHIAFSDIGDISYSLDRMAEYTDRDYNFLSQ